MILVLKMTKKYHITWYWCQNIKDNMVEKRVKKFGHGSPPPFSGNARKKSFFFRRASLSHIYCYGRLEPWSSYSNFSSNSFTYLPWTLGWVVNVKSWPIISAIAKFTAFGPTFAIKIVSEPQKKFSSPWVCVWKNGFSHCRVKNQSCHRIKCDLLKPISRKMQDQWKKN